MSTSSRDTDARTGVRPARIPLSEPVLAGRELEYVTQCIESGWVSSAGSFVGLFESTVGDYTGAAHAVAVQSGTAALHLALLAAGVERGTEVLTPTLTFIASVNAIAYCGAQPVFLDVEPDYWQLDPAKLEQFLTAHARRADDGSVINAASGRRIAAIMAVHLLGHPVDRDRINATAAAYGLPVVEDAAQCLGAVYRGRRIGGDGRFVALSFNGNKLVTCGGGGMVLSSAPDVARRVRHLSTQAKQDELRFIHDEVGYNYRLTNVAAAIGTAQLERIDVLLERKREIHAAYAQAFADDARVRLVGEAPWARSSFWLPTIMVAGGAPERDEVMTSLRSLGIDCRPPWHPNHRQAMYAADQSYAIEHADRLVSTGLHLPGSPSLSDDDQQYVVESVRRALG